MRENGLGRATIGLGLGGMLLLGVVMEPVGWATEAPSANPSQASTAPAPSRQPLPPTSAQAPPAAAKVPPPAVQGLDPKDAKGMVRIGLQLPRPVRLGGFAYSATFDAQEFAMGNLEQPASLTGYLCQANTTTPGVVRLSCVGLPQEDKSGAVAVFPVHFRQRPPVAADFKVIGNELVNDLGAALEGVQLGIVLVE